MNDSDHSSEDYSSSSGEKPADDSRKPFVRPELRHEVGVVDGTGSEYSDMREFD